MHECELTSEKLDQLLITARHCLSCPECVSIRDSLSNIVSSLENFSGRVRTSCELGADADFYSTECLVIGRRFDSITSCESCDAKLIQKLDELAEVAKRWYQASVQ